MKKTMRTSEVMDAYQVLNTAKYGKMEDADKIRVFKLTRALKPAATAFDEASKDAAAKMKPEGFDALLEKAQDYERRRNGGETEGLPLTEQEYYAFVAQLKDYNRLVGEAVKELADKEVELEIEPLTEDGMAKLMASNEWTMAQVMAVSEVACE